MAIDYNGNNPMSLAQLAAIVPPGRDPSQREQIIASQNLAPTPYSINNFLEFGNGQGVAGGAPTTTGLYAGHNYTLVDNKTGTILAQGNTPEAIQQIQDIANNLSATQGQNADWRLYDANPQSGVTNMHEKMPGAYLDLSTPGDPRGVVVAGNMPNDLFKDKILPALTPIALAAAAYFGGGALLGQLGGATTTAGIGAGATGGAVAGGAAALPAVAAIPAATATSALAPIVVTGATGLTAAQTAALAAGLASAYPAASVLSGTGTGASSNVVNGVDQANGDIVVSKYRPINPPSGFDPIAFAAAPSVPTSSILESLSPLNPPPADAALMQPQTVVSPPPEEPILPTLGPLVAPPSTPPTLPDKGGVLGTGLNVPQLLSLGSVGADLLQSLLAGDGSTGPQTPYVSPFGTGAGVGFGTGQDMRANPNIADYERYGFGPEAMFFRPEYTGLLPANATPTQAQPAMTINPALMPII